jgi:hypothetical protein
MLGWTVRHASARHDRVPLRTPNFASDGRWRPAQTLVRTAVSPSYSHGGSQGFKSPHLHPLSRQVRASPAWSGRRSLHVAAAARPQIRVAVQPRRLSGPGRLGFQASTMTAESSRTLTPTNADPLAHPAQPGRPRGRPGHFSTTSHADGRVQVDASLAQHDLRRLRARGPTGAATEPVVDTARRRRGPYPSGCQPVAVLQNLTRFGRNGRKNAREPDAHTGIGHPDRQTPAPDAWTLDTRVDIAHLDTRHSHRTPDTGRTESG